MLDFNEESLSSNDEWVVYNHGTGEWDPVQTEYDDGEGLLVSSSSCSCNLDGKVVTIGCSWCSGYLSCGLV